MSNQPPTWILYYAIPLFFLAVWFFVSWLLSRLSGWSSLAATYRADRPAEEELLSFQSARFGPLIGYNNCLKFGSNGEGLYVSVFAPFRFTHPPLTIPWTEIVPHSAKMFFRDAVRLEFPKQPRVAMYLYNSTAQKLADRSAGGLRLPEKG